MRIWVDVYDASDNRLGVGPVESVMSAQFVRPLDGAGTIRLRCVATDPRALDLLTNERRVRVFAEDTGGVRVLGEGVIRNRTLMESPSGVSLRIDGPDILDELKRRNCLLARIFNQQTVSNVADDLIALADGWTVTIDAAIEDELIDARYDGVTLLKAFQDLAQRYGYHLRLGGDTREIEISPFGDDNGLRILKTEHLTQETLANPALLMVQRMQTSEDTEDVFNWVLPIGAGEGTAGLTLEKSTRSIVNGDPYDIQTMEGPDGQTLYYLEDNSSVAVYGEIQKVVQFKQIAPLSNSDLDIENAANALYDATVNFLTRHSEPQEFYTVSVKNVKETILPGDKIHVNYRAGIETEEGFVSYLDVRGDFWVLRVNESIGLDSSVVDLEISNVDRTMESMAAVVIGGLESIALRNLKPQITSSTRSYVYDREIANGYSAIVPVEFTDATLEVQRVRMRLKTSPFRATASAAASGGGSSQTSASGGGSTESSTSTTHQHLIMRSEDGTSLQGSLATRRFTIVEQTTGTLYHFDADSDVGATARFFDMQASGGHTHDVDIPAHTHDVDIPAHTHELNFGISDDTETPVGVTVWVNGTDQTLALFGEAPLAATGGNLNEVADMGILTGLIEDAVGGLRQVHEIEIRCTGGQGRAEVTIEVFEITQAINLI